MDKSRIFQGLSIMVGLIVLGIMIPTAVSRLKSYERTVDVKGLCEKEVKADKAIWPLVYKVVGNDLNTVYEKIESNNKAIEKFLLEGGISKDEITVTAPVVSDKYTQEYGSNDRAFRYVAKTTVTVCTKDVDKVLALIDRQISLILEGITIENDWDAKTEFMFESLNDIKPQMIEEATRNAREVAMKFAQDSNSRLGKIKKASQGTFSIEARDSNTPYIKKVRVVTNVVYYLSK
ncbi:MAG: SIMPL domain-containing protein [Bacteroidales bacterium]|nr:SIMPL domain-containing protein [Candidatus Cacconaster equi]